MSKPVIKQFEPFDANKDMVVSFTYTGNQPYRNRAVIQDAETMEVIKYDNEYEDTMQYKHTIPKNTLQNGKQYTITIQCFDRNGEGSSISNKMYFWCFTTPLFKFGNVNTKDIIVNSSLVVEIDYSQAEDEPLEQTKFYIYNASNELLHISDIVYGSKDVTYNYSGLVNEAHYLLKATGYTKHGINLDTGLIEIIVRFENPSAYALIYANEDPDALGTGAVNYDTNIVAIRPNRDDYTVKDSCVDVRGDYITYEEDFEIINDFTLAIKHTYVNGKVLDMSNKDGEHIELYMIEDKLGCRYQLVIDGRYTIFSDYIDGMEDNLDFLTVYIRRKNNIYDIYAYYELAFLLKDYKIWLNGEEPEDATKYDFWGNLGMFDGYITDANVKIIDDEPAGVSNNTVWIGGKK